MMITKAMLDKCKTKKGGFSLLQIEMAVELVGSPWAKKLLATELQPEWWQSFKEKKGLREVKEPKPKALNAMPGKDGWDWQPKKQDVPAIKMSGKLSKTNRGKKKLISRKDNADFYTSDEWRQLRVRVLEKFACKCMMCGRSPKDHGIVVHVDHIKPRSKFPKLSLEISNLQLLCEDCNIGKGNKYQTDWRPVENGKALN